MTLVPQIALKLEDRPELGLKFIEFPAPGPSRTICLAWRQGCPRSTSFELLAKQLITSIPEELRLIQAATG